MQRRKMKNSGAVRPFGYLHFLPRVLAFLLALGAMISLIVIYGNGKAALASASYSEKVQMSLEISEGEDYENNASYSERFNALSEPVFVSSDGVALTGSGVTIGNAFYNLLGYSSTSETRYLVDVYGDSAEMQHYSVLTGIRGAADNQTEITLTLNAGLQQHMYDYLTANGVEGFVLAYDYNTGDILCSVSTPGASSTDDVSTLVSGSLLNKSLYSTNPGSTMKIVTLLLLADQGTDLSSLAYTCTGSYTLEDGTTITCSGVHGTLDAAGAVAASCNAWFAQAVTQNLTKSEIISTLEALGFSVNNSSASASIGKVTVSPGSIQIRTYSQWTFTDVFSLCGETTVTVEPALMIQLAAACVSDTICSPVFLAEEEGTASTVFDEYRDALSAVSTVWQESSPAIAAGHSEALTVCKTGTYENSDGSVQKNFFGASASLQVAFYVACENYRDEDGTTLAVMPADVADELLGWLSGT